MTSPSNAAMVFWEDVEITAVFPHFKTATAEDWLMRKCLLNEGTEGVNFDSLYVGKKLKVCINIRNYVVKVQNGSDVTS